jgi:hypothetical protein
MTASDRYSIPTLRGDKAKRFREFDSQKPTAQDIENQEKLKAKYLQKCKILGN